MLQWRLYCCSTEREIRSDYLKKHVVGVAVRTNAVKPGEQELYDLFSSDLIQIFQLKHQGIVGDMLILKSKVPQNDAGTFLE